MTRRRRKWSAPEELELMRLWYSPVSDKEIEYRLGRHRGVIRRKAMQLGYHHSRLAIRNDLVPRPTEEH